MVYKPRNAEDSKILVGLAELSLPERWKRLKDLEAKLQEARESLEKNREKKKKSQVEDRAILADENGVIELRCRLSLERSEYLSLKEITPDWEEPSD
jgi:uncharacterized protein YyaL (SSP411 family)